MRTVARPSLESAVTIVTALLVLLGAWVLGHLVWAVIAPQSVLPAASSLALATDADNNTPTYPGFRELALLSPLGRADQQPLEINAPDTKLSWTLKGVLSDPDPARSAAILVTQGQPEKLYRVGASLPGQVRLEQVLPDRVMLMRDGQLETLRLKRNESAGAGRRSAPRLASLPTTDDTQTLAPDGGVARIDRDAWLNDPQRFMEVISANPVMVDGVMYGLEVARALLEHPETAHLAIDAVAWTDEEGTYTSCLGSRSFAGRLTDAELAHTNAAGESVAEAIERVGLTGVARAQLEPQRHVGYLEAHIEQGPWLEDDGHLIGVVTSIVGIRSVSVTVTGEQNHAGTTPMARRADAGVAMFSFGHELHQRLAALAGPTTVWTIGVAHLHPGAESIIPVRATCTVQFRDPDDALLQSFEDAIVTLGAEFTERGPCRVEVERRRSPILPTVMDQSLREPIREAAEAVVPGRWVDMPSAAGHDPMELAHVMPTAMLFIPSIGGISHDFAEDSHDDDIVRGCEVLADAAVRILRNAG